MPSIPQILFVLKVIGVLLTNITLSLRVGSSWFAWFAVLAGGIIVDMVWYRMSYNALLPLNTLIDSSSQDSLCSKMWLCTFDIICRIHQGSYSGPVLYP